MKFTTSYIEDTLSLFRYYKKLAERALEQVADEQLSSKPNGTGNSITIIVKHMVGNMRSRWTNLLTSDGEKPERDRDLEFVNAPMERDVLLVEWEDGWNCLFAALEALSDKDLGRTITIRGEAHSVMQAVNRQVAHYSYHVGQIVLLAKHFAHDRWEELTVPLNQSEKFNQDVADGKASQR